MSMSTPGSIDRTAAVFERITSAIESIVTGDDWQRMLGVASRFHTYTPSNVWAIYASRRDATRVAGYQTWRSLGRQVRAGERGIAILAPILNRHPDTTATAPVATAPDPTAAATIEHARGVRGFRVVHVFDIAQTDGVESADVRPVLLSGDDPDGIWDRLVGRVTASGFKLERGWCHGANGWTDHQSRMIRVLHTLEPLAACRTLAHELAHARLHGEPVRLDVDRARREVEAESVAYLIMDHFNVSADQYSFPYIARWSCGDITRIAQTAATVIGCARQLITELTATTDQPTADQHHGAGLSVAA